MTFRVPLRPITGEVNAFDLTIIEAVRRFCPDVYLMVRKNPLYLTHAISNWSKGRYFTEEEKKKGAKQFFGELDAVVVKSNEAPAISALLSWIFPDYAAAKAKGTTTYSLSRPTNRESAEAEKRICHPDYFPIFFRAAVPEEMFSDAELRRLVRQLSEAKTEPAVENIFSQTLNSIAPGHAKRDDFLFKLGRAMDQLDGTTAELLAYAAASCATDYQYDLTNIGEAARGLNIVFTAAQKVSASPAVQQVLSGAMTRATDDTFAARLVQFTENKDRNKVLTDFSHVNVEDLKHVFVERMRQRYGPSVNIQQVSIAQGDWWAFRLWADSSAEDTEIERGFWRRFVGRSRKRLAQAINFIYPGGCVWSDDPTPIVDKLFPMDETARLLELPDDQDNQLDEVETRGIERFRNLLNGKYPQNPGDLT